MWCERVIQNCRDPSAADWGGRVLDWVDIEWNECGRVLKKQTRDGQPVRVLLPLGQRLSHGDLIHEDASRAIFVNVVPSEVVVASPSDALVMAKLALELGNLHLPVQIQSGEIIFIEDAPAMSVLDAMRITWSKDVRRFEPAAVISAPAGVTSPSLRVILRSRKDEDQEPDRTAPRSSASKV